MNRLLYLPLALLLGVSVCHAQPNQLFIKKGVYKKKAFSEGDRIHVLLADGKEMNGIITHIRDSVIFINGEEIVASHINTLFIDGIKKNRLPDIKTMLLIGGGVGLTTIGLSLNNANDPKTAFISALAIGYAPLLLKFFGGRFFYALRKKKYKMGRRYRLQVFDIRVPSKLSF